MTDLIPGSEIDYDIDFCDISLQLDSGKCGRSIPYGSPTSKCSPVARQKLKNSDSLSINESRIDDLDETMVISESQHSDFLNDSNGSDATSLDNDPLDLEHYISTQGTSRSKSSKTSKTSKVSRASAASRKTTDSTGVKDCPKTRFILGPQD